MDEALRQLVRRRAADRCEYCHLPQAGHDERFSIDHVVARKHGGSDAAGNLALCCLRCNLCKGPNLSGIDSDTGLVVQLFNPRRDLWTECFSWKGAMVIGLNDVGRATVAVLRMNAPERVLLRQALLAEGTLPRLD